MIKLSVRPSFNARQRAIFSQCIQTERGHELENYFMNRLVNDMAVEILGVFQDRYIAPLRIPVSDKECYKHKVRINYEKFGLVRKCGYEEVHYVPTVLYDKLIDFLIDEQLLPSNFLEII